MKRVQSRTSSLCTGLLVFLIILLFGIAGVVPGVASSPKEELVDKFLERCVGKAEKAAECDKLRKDFVEIVKDALQTLGYSLDRSELPDIVRMFRSDEVELRIAAADAIGMIGPQDADVDMLIPVTNDPVPDVSHAVFNMLKGEGKAISLLKQRLFSVRGTGRTPEKPADPAKFGLPVAPKSTYLFDSSDASVGRLSYLIKDMNEATAFFKGKAKKGPFPLAEFKDKYHYQLQDENEAANLARKAEMENTKPPDPTNAQAYADYMQKIESAIAKGGIRLTLDSYQPDLFGSPTVYVLEERQIGQRSYPTRYAVVYQELAFKRPGYRLSWMTIPDEAIKAAQAVSLKEQREEEAQQAASRKEDEADKKRDAELEALTKKKDAAEKKQFKKGQADLEKELGF